jgi:hypothetical protein
MLLYPIPPRNAVPARRSNSSRVTVTITTARSPPTVGRSGARVASATVSASASPWRWAVVRVSSCPN